MDPDVRRIIAVTAHCRCTGDCPNLVHSLGTGESFAIEPGAQGFRDVASGIGVLTSGRDEIVRSDHGAIELRFDGDVAFFGRLQTTGEAFTGRAGGGVSVTIYEASGERFFQYAMEHNRGS
jgi:hypothetical protein